METLDAIFARHSYRGRYRDTPVPREDLLKIMEVGLAAPSGCNKQTTSLIGIDDPEVLKKVHEVIEPDVAPTAPAAICVLTQRIIAYRDRCFATHDYAAAIENMLLAAAAMGYDSCWYEGHVTDTDRIGDKIAKVLGVPDGYELVCFLPVGIAADPVTGPKKKAFSERAWLNGFGKIEQAEQNDELK
ncbi:MAG: nitroreductase family protein [Clostridia bacterium]|nr:nitroreductase family protein [Clostridia bacterium]